LSAQTTDVQFDKLIWIKSLNQLTHTVSVTALIAGTNEYLWCSTHFSACALWSALLYLPIYF